jgi:hypothetical protein
MLPHFDSPTGSAGSWAKPKTGTFAERLIDCEEDRTLRAVLGEIDVGVVGVEWLAALFRRPA